MPVALKHLEHAGCCSDDASKAAAAALSLGGRKLSVVLAERKTLKQKKVSVTSSDAKGHATVACALGGQLSVCLNNYLHADLSPNSIILSSLHLGNTSTFVADLSRTLSQPY